MNLPIYIFDPTAADAQSKVRGIGRYLQVLQENLSDLAICLHAILPILNGFCNGLKKGLMKMLSLE